jgi:anion transporter
MNAFRTVARGDGDRHASRRPLVLVAVTLVACSAIGYAWAFGDLSGHGAITLVVFLVAIWMWIAAPIEDTYVALAAALVLVVTGALDGDDFTGTLGDDLIWLLIGAFVIAAAVTATGLPTRFASRVVELARTPRQLVHLLTAALLVTTFAIPATSGRAALALPVFLGLAAVLSDRKRLVLCLAVLFPTVILLSAIGSLLGAGAHLVTNQILDTTIDENISFLEWLLLGLPFALAWSHLAAEIILLLLTRAEDRRAPLSVPASALASDDESTVAGTSLSISQRRVLILLAAVIAAWCTEPIHDVDAEIIALIGALAAITPRFGATSLSAALKTVPWSLLIFMAATLALAIALTDSGAAEWLAAVVFSPLEIFGSWAAAGFVIVVIVVSIAAHIVLQSRSARSAVLIPIVVAVAPTVGIDPLAAAFISTAAAGFCLTLTSSAKPVAMFAATDEIPGYTSRDLRRVSAVLAPVSAILIAIFAFQLWPALGLSLYPQ